MTQAEIDRGIERLVRRLEEVKAFRPTLVRDPFNDPQVARLTAALATTLGDVFGYNTPEHRIYGEASKLIPPFAFINVDITPGLVAQKFEVGKQQAIELLTGAIQYLSEKSINTSSPSITNEADTVENTKIFVVHGHDDGAKHELARFLEKIGLEAIILQEQPNQGRTIIEKFLKSANEVAFAIVLLTPDDLGSAAAATSQEARARQNVIFELGYFVGKLGRGKACLLRKGSVEIPSDLHGVVYTDLDAGGGWKIALLREFKEVGLKFDANRVWG
jgi:predicted nucleotide-binding protein